MKLSYLANVALIAMLLSVCIWLFTGSNPRRGTANTPLKAETSPVQNVATETTVQIALASVGTTSTVVTKPAAMSNKDQPLERLPALKTDRPPQLKFGTTSLAWELQLKAVKSRAKGGTAAAKAILDLLPYLPQEAFDTAVEQALETLPDSDWSVVARPLMLNPQLDGRILSGLFSDLMDRPAAVAVPILSQLAKEPTHPFASFAWDNLKLLLGDDLKFEGPSPAPVTDTGQTGGSSAAGSQ